MPTVPTKLDLAGVKNKVMIVFYKNLQNHNIIERETTNPIDESVITRVAGDWGRYEKEALKTLPVTATNRTTFKEPSKESCSLLFTEEVLKFCSRHNIYHECCIYHTLFIENFQNIQKIDISISEEPEILNYQKLCFILTIADSVENVLRSLLSQR